ncbi:hypothetical protein T11_2193 [Trichinella zimbabwensis]|uniref:Uncharacterized protein n=1 Tax=Trichinella zimbabwensis TaxID=268475 RepID=A0A0V1F3Z3_9BILA|nr:hypothetical protein T11_2193 [Trichinella zimbabwensis]
MVFLGGFTCAHTWRFHMCSHMVFLGGFMCAHTWYF